MRLWPAILLICLALASCRSATVSESQCVAGDWQTIGYRDGSAGVTSTQLLRHQDACVPHGVIPDRSEYLLGWDRGVRVYCQAANGYTVGEQGGRYTNNLCPEDLRGGFITAYREGLRLYQARAEVAALERLIQRKEQRLEHLKREIVASGTAQLNDELTTEQRIELLATTQRLIEERSAVEAELPRRARELAYKERQLVALQATLASTAY
jgi:hypothetical protein